MERMYIYLKLFVGNQCLPLFSHLAFGDNPFVSRRNKVADNGADNFARPSGGTQLQFPVYVGLILLSFLI